MNIQKECKLESFLNANIAIFKHMGIKVMACSSERVILHASLINNTNDKATAFGGSLNVAAILAAWSWVHIYLSELNNQKSYDVMIQKSNMSYKIPVKTNFNSICLSPSQEKIEQFTKMLLNKERARISLCSVIEDENSVICCHFQGQFVAVAKQ